MTAAEIDRILRESVHLDDTSDDPELRALRMAIFVEDIFDLTLRDDQLASGVLDDRQALRSLLIQSVSGP